ncbi:MAG: hypothetical protein EOM80_18890 [Erysipelotrichia bacterium]|nr:hypothetical protein [Erysipelotrichia bacterium]
MKYGRIYGGTDPELIEGDVFKTTLKVPEFGSSEETAADNSNQNKPGQVAADDREPQTFAGYTIKLYHFEV